MVNRLRQIKNLNLDEKEDREKCREFTIIPIESSVICEICYQQDKCLEEKRGDGD